MKLFKLLLILLISTSGSLFAQTNTSKESPDDWNQKKWQFICSKVKLTDDVTSKVYSIFLNYEKTVWTLHQKNKDTFKSALQDKSRKQNFAIANDSYVDLQWKLAQALKNYNIQLKKLLPPETLFKYYKAEREYKRKLLLEFREKRSAEKSSNN